MAGWVALALACISVIALVVHSWPRRKGMFEPTGGEMWGWKGVWIDAEEKRLRVEGNDDPGRVYEIGEDVAIRKWTDRGTPEERLELIAIPSGMDTALFRIGVKDMELAFQPFAPAPASRSASADGWRLFLRAEHIVPPTWAQ